MMSPLLSLPSPMNPEPLIRILADDGFKGIVEKLSIGFYILIKITGMDQIKRLFDDQTMFLKPIPNHENRQNRSAAF